MLGYYPQLHFWQKPDTHAWYQLSNTVDSSHDLGLFKRPALLQLKLGWSTRTRIQSTEENLQQKESRCCNSPVQVQTSTWLEILLQYLKRAVYKRMPAVKMSGPQPCVWKSQTVMHLVLQATESWGVLSFLFHTTVFYFSFEKNISEYQNWNIKATKIIPFPFLFSIMTLIFFTKC